MARPIGLLVAALLAAACEPEPPADLPDAAASDAGQLRPAEPAPPAAPMPIAWTCPDGWMEIANDGGHTCAPWTERPRCDPGEVLLPGRGCEPLAADCASDAPPELDASMAFVRAGALEGDGSRARPFGTISEAARAGFHDIALAPGEHELGPLVSRGLTLIGTCPTTTTIRLREITTLADITIRRARVTGPQISVPHDHTLTLEAVELADMERALQVRGTLRAHRLAIRDVSEIAIVAFNPDGIELEDASIERTPAALWAGTADDEPAYEPHATVTLRRVSAAEIAGNAFQVATLAGLEVSEVAVEVAAAAIVADVQALVVRDVSLSHLTHVAIGAVGGGTRTLAGVHIEDAGGGIALGGGVFDARDIVVAGTRLALSTNDGERGHAERVFVDGARTYAIELSGGEATLADIRVAGVEATTDDTGAALAVESGARVTLDRARFTGTEHVGLGVNAGAALEARDLIIDDVRSHAGADGYGVAVLDGSTLELARARIEHASAIALVVEDASASVEDLAIADVRAPPGAFGVGVHVHAGRDGSSVPSMLALARATIAGTRGAGAVVFGPGAALRASDLVVGDTRSAGEGGVALALMEGAAARVERFVLRGSELAGVLLGSGTDGELVRGRIERNPFGLLADPSLSFNAGSTPGFSLRDVVFVENGVDYQPTRRALPELGAVSF